MSLKVAVFFDEGNKLTSIFNPGIVRIFEKNDYSWVATEEFPSFLDMKKGITTFREQITGFVNHIRGVKVVVASEISGIPYNIIDKEGFDICETSEFSEALLDEILKAKSTEVPCCHFQAPPNMETTPTETQISGNYFFDLKKLLSKKTSITSKQALLPFLKDTPFHLLEVVCDHIPPWFDVEFQKLGLNHEITKLSENNYVVNISKQTCNE